MEELRIDRQICKRCDWDGELFIQVHGSDIRIRHEGCIDALGGTVRAIFWDENEEEPRESAEISRDSASTMLNELLDDYDQEIMVITKHRENVVTALGAIGPVKG